MMIDTHCHMQFKAYDADRDAVLAVCRDHQVIMNVVGTQQDTSKKAVDLASMHDNIYATIGLHPIQEHVVAVEEEGTSFISRGELFDMAYYDTLAMHPKVIAVGETGLDKYHIPKDSSVEEILATQTNIFLQHVALAHKYHLPLVMHVRDAHAEMIALLQQTKQTFPNITGVIHCFTGNWEQAKAYLEMGLYLGFTGVITFSPKKTDPLPQEELLNVVKQIPINRMLVETDAPYLAPQAYRGKRTEPWMVKEVIHKIAIEKGLSYDAVKDATIANAKTLFSKIRG